MKEIKCEGCGKIEPAENFKKNIKFFINWIEILPDQWLCRECKENKYDRNLIMYKMGFNKDSWSE